MCSLVRHAEIRNYRDIVLSYQSLERRIASDPDKWSVNSVVPYLFNLVGFFNEPRYVIDQLWKFLKV